MDFNTSKLANVLGGVGVIGSLFYCMKHKAPIGQTLVYALVFGVAGVVIGNTVTHFYE